MRKILLHSLINCKDTKNVIITLKSYFKQDNFAPPLPHTKILIELDFNVKFSLLRILQFLSDLKNAITCK